MIVSIQPDYHFNDTNHKKNFLKYMFAASKPQLEKHDADDFQIYVNGKTYDTQGDKGLSDRQKALEILTEKEVDLQDNLQKAFIIYCEPEKAEDELDEAFSMFAEYFDTIPSLTDNISNICAVSHYDQTGEKPHIHVFYEATKDVQDELQNNIIKMINNG